MSCTLSAYGHVGRDPESRTTPSGKKVVEFSLAVSRKRGGEDSTTWFRVVCWNEGLGGVVERYVRKGASVFVTGELSEREWTKQDGSTDRSLEVYLDRLTLGARAAGDAPPRQERPAGKPSGGGRRYEQELDDDIPF